VSRPRNQTPRSAIIEGMINALENIPNLTDRLDTKPAAVRREIEACKKKKKILERKSNLKRLVSIFVFGCKTPVS
jgi:hypothetical protein